MKAHPTPGQQLGNVRPTTLTGYRNAKGSATHDPRGGHVRLYWALIDSPAWVALSATDQRAYVALRRVLGKTNNGDLSLPLSRARHHGITSPSTLAKSLRALIAVGLIAVTRRGGCTRGGQRLPTLYCFTDEHVYEMRPKLIDARKATDDWQRVESKAHGRALIRKAQVDAQVTAKKKSLLHKSNSTATPNESVKPKTASDIEAWRPAPLQNLKRGTKTKSDCDASNDADFGTIGLT